MFKIQRVPGALNQLLSIQEGTTPQTLEASVQGALELLQLYGLNQLQSGFANGAATAEGTAVPLTLHTAAWTILFAVTGAVVKTATVTALRASVALNRRTLFSPLLFAEELGPFGATDTGTCSFGGLLPYPLVCPPGSTVSCTPNVIGTDATANVSVFAEFGVLG